MRPTIEELEKNYNAMHDYQLLDLAADAGGLRPDAIILLRKVLKKKGLSSKIISAKKELEPRKENNSQRMGRSEFIEYYIILISCILVLFLGVLPTIVNTKFAFLGYIFFFPVVMLYRICSKRCHDIGENGFYVLAPASIFVLLGKKGDEGNNKYGPPPLKK